MYLYFLGYPMKVTWSYDGKTSQTKVIVRDDSKICFECEGFDGHFAECSKLKAIKEKERTEEQIRLLNEAIIEACKNDTSHTKRMAEN